MSQEFLSLKVDTLLSDTEIRALWREPSFLVGVHGCSTWQPESNHKRACHIHEMAERIPHTHTHARTQKKGQILSAVSKPALDSIISGIIRTGESVHPCSPFSCVLGSVLVKELKKKSNDLLYELGSNGGACCISCHLLLLLHHLSLALSVSLSLS